MAIKSEQAKSKYTKKNNIKQWVTVCNHQFDQQFNLFFIYRSQIHFSVVLSSFFLSGLFSADNAVKKTIYLNA